MGVVIAGGTGALGSAVVRELLDAGYDCTVTWIVEKELERARAELGERVSFVRADLMDPQGGADDAVASVDDLEAVVDLVGGFSSGPLVHETSWDDFERMLRLNLAPAFNLAHAAMPPSWPCRPVPRSGPSRARPAT
jgi:NAD(P)-dependent dehydrogenase (short-subunit alcohol dehydrogenase family)